jgi:hypothetical protein
MVVRLPAHNLSHQDKESDMASVEAQKFQFVQESENLFLSLFPHRFDYIYAHHANPGDTPDWLTESRHPLSDRLIQQGGFLYGVRFGAQTQYALLDLDLNSRYHPNQDPHAIERILAALEPLGLVTSLHCTSSYSGGLHLYFPFSENQCSWKLAIALSCLLENAGFKLLPGQLEVFPNPKPYIVEGAPSLFNAHRLPLQAGSYLLNSDFEPIRSSPERFVEQWQWAQQKNCLDEKTLKRIIQQAKRCCFRISGKADKFINDLNAEIEPGWTDFGQTNYLLGRITMREYIFHHILEGGTPLEGKELVEAIATTAQALPGFNEYCRHRYELEHRVEEWVRCIEKSHYFRYGDTKGKFKSKLDSTEIEPAIKGLPSWNQQQSMLFDVQAWLESRKEAAREANEQALRIKGEAQQQAHVDRMQRFLVSGDPILMAEAIAWADINPGVLDEERLVVLSLRDAIQGFIVRLQGLVPRMQKMLWGFWADCWQPIAGISQNAEREESPS